MIRSAALSLMLCGPLLSFGFAQVSQTTSLQPTKLEAFAHQPTAHVTWSNEVWRAESAEARVVVMAIVVEDSAQPQERMRGVRLDLAKQNVSDQVYLDEAKLEATRKALNEITSGIRSFRRERSDSPYRYLGAEEFWHPYPTVHTLNAAYHLAPDSSGLSLSAFTGQAFRFPDHSPAQLSAAIARAIDELKRH